MSREYAEVQHAELGYRYAGRKELSLRERAALRDDADAFAKTPEEFERLISQLRSKAYRVKVPAEVRRARAQQNKPTREARKAEKAAVFAAAKRAKRKERRRREQARIKADAARWERQKLRRRVRFLRQQQDPSWRAKVNARQRADRQRDKAQRLRSTVYACSICGVEWCAAFRIRPGTGRPLCSVGCVAEDHRRRERARARSGKKTPYRLLPAEKKRRVLEWQNKKARTRRAAQVEARKVQVNTCARCGARWCVTPWRRLVRVSKWCSLNCQKYSSPSAHPEHRKKRDARWRERSRDAINARARAGRRRRRLEAERTNRPKGEAHDGKKPRSGRGNAGRPAGGTRT